MGNKTSFIGHRRIYECDIEDKIREAIEEQIKNGCYSFIVGSHGQFDAVVLSQLKIAKQINDSINFEVVITNLNVLRKKSIDDMPYEGVDTVMYDIEEIHYKQQIIVSNKKMIDECDTLICYVDERRIKSGAKTVLNYAKRKGLKIINLFS